MKSVAGMQKKSQEKGKNFPPIEEERWKDFHVPTGFWSTIIYAHTVWRLLKEFPLSQILSLKKLTRPLSRSGVNSPWQHKAWKKREKVASIPLRKYATATGKKVRHKGRSEVLEWLVHVFWVEFVSAVYCIELVVFKSSFMVFFPAQ